MNEPNDTHSAALNEIELDNASEGLTFYRCFLCRRVVSKWDIDKYFACPSCGHTKVSPSNLTLLEKLEQIIKHPLVWKWNDESVSADE